MAVASAWLVAAAFFVVVPQTPAAASGSVAVQASPTSGTAGVDISGLGATATLSGLTVLATNTSIAFSLYSDSTCTTPVAGVTGAGTLTTSDSVTYTASYSQDWTPPAAGTYYWQASYSDLVNGTAISVCSDPNNTANQVIIGQATPTLTTTATPATAAVGQTVQDDATLSGGSAPTGTITFTLTNASSTVVATEKVSVSGNGAYATSTGYTATAPGTYQWSATYGGDANNTSANDQGGAGEQVIIGQATPTLTTTATPATAAVGQTVQDDATLSGGSAPTGTITFTLTNASSTVVATEKVSVSGNGAYATSTGYTATAPGTYQWSATYGGDANNTSASDQGGAGEQVTVGKASPTITTALNASSIAAGGTDFDAATLNGFAAPGGSSSTVTYTVYSNITCTQNARVAGTLSVNESTGAVPNSSTLSFPTVGTFYWQAVFSGDANNNTATSSCSSEPLTVGKASPTITTALNASSIAAGGTDFDAATLNGFAAPGGSSSTVTYTVYSNITCTQNARVAGTLSVNESTGAVPNSSTLSFPTVGTFYWQAVFSGDANNNTATSSCSSEPLTVGKASPALTTQASPTSGTVGVQITVKDTATITGGASPTGSVTFTLYTNATCTSAVTGVSGNATISAGTASFSASWKPAAVSTYYWGAVYNGDANNSTVSTCGGIPEQIVIGKASPTISTVASPTTGTVGKAISTLKDTATLSGAPIAPTGTVTFKFYSNNSCTTAVTGVTGSGTVASSSASYTVAWTPKAAGTYYWIASYAGDANNTAVASRCGEPVVITARPSISTTANPKSAGTGTTLQDSATLVSTSNLVGTGSITFKLYAPGDSSCASAIHSETVTAVKTNGPFKTTTGFTAKTIGTYQWTAAFTGDANNAAISSKCGAEPVAVGPQISEITPIATTCAQFASGFATSLPSYQYTLGGSKIATVTPSSFTYWVKVPSTGTYKITQSTNETSKKLLLGSGSSVYDKATASSCTTVSGGITQSTTSDAVTVKVSSGSGPFYIGLNFSTSKVIGEAAPSPSTTVQYTVGAGLTGATSVIDLKLG